MPMPLPLASRCLTAVVAGVLSLTICTGIARAETYREGFDDVEQTSWSVRFDKEFARLGSHNRRADLFVHGTASECISLDSTGDAARFQLEHQLPKSQIIDDLDFAIWIRSNQKGINVWLKVVFPHETDPNTGKPLATFLKGDTSSQVNKWQQVRCQTPHKALEDRIRQLRSALSRPTLDVKDALVDRVVLTGNLVKGVTEICLDELRFGPVIAPAESAATEAVTQASTTIAVDDRPVAEFVLDRLLVNDRPFYPLMAARHEEDLDVLREMGLNVVWTQDVEDLQTLAGLRERNMWAMATPPRAVTADGQLVNSRDVNLIPFGPETAPVLLWNLGARVKPEARDDLIKWMDQISAADRNYRRPVAVDVIGGDERTLSRQIPMLGLSRHMAQTTFDYKQYRDWLIKKRKLARPGSFIWTWVQTEPVSHLLRQRAAAGQNPIVLEPEQLRLQVYAAWAAGCRGVGYWKTIPFTADVPGANERRLAITQLNLEAQLLQPWLASGTVAEHVPFYTVPEANREQLIGRGSVDFRNSQAAQFQRDALLREREYQLQRAARRGSELEATMLRSDRGMLLLPIWYGSGSQFVPGQLAANDAIIIVPGVNESASAYEISTTFVKSLPRERVAGGLKITLSKFDQTSAIVITSDMNYIAELRQKVASIAEKSSRTCVELARAKYERVRLIDEELVSLGQVQPDRRQLLLKAEQFLRTADEALARNDYHSARENAGDSMQLQRILQRAHWNDAVVRLDSPVSSPHTLCYQTLPDHWRMIQRLGSSPLENDNNLLPSGNFEDFDTMRVAGWKNSLSQVPGIRAGTWLVPSAHEGTYALRLAANAVVTNSMPASISDAPVTFTSPPVEVRSGQIVLITGWIRVPSAPVGTLDGVLVYDNITGPVGAIRWTTSSTDWKRFSILREVNESGPMTVSLQLTGLGEAQFDDLRIIPHSPQITPPAPEQPLAKEPSGGFGNPLKLLERFPRWTPPGFRRQ